MDSAVGDQQALAEALAAAAREAAASLDNASKSGEELKRELEGRTSDLQAVMEKARALKPDIADNAAKERRLEGAVRSAELKAARCVCTHTTPLNDSRLWFRLVLSAMCAAFVQG